VIVLAIDETKLIAVGCGFGHCAGMLEGSVGRVAVRWGISKPRPRQINLQWYLDDGVEMLKRVRLSGLKEVGLSQEMTCGVGSMAVGETNVRQGWPPWWQAMGPSLGYGAC
jgi:hypothetical protein